MVTFDRTSFPVEPDEVDRTQQIRLVPTGADGKAHPGAVEPGPPNGQRYLCPVNCDWYLDVPPLDISNTSLAEVFGIGVMASVAYQRQLESVEAALQGHLETHSVQEWARALADAQQRALDAEQALLALSGQAGSARVFSEAGVQLSDVDQFDEDEALARSRAEQEAYARMNPLQATVAYTADLPEGTVGIRR